MFRTLGFGRILANVVAAIFLFIYRGLQMLSCILTLGLKFFFVWNFPDTDLVH